MFGKLGGPPLLRNHRPQPKQQQPNASQSVRTPMPPKNRPIQKQGQKKRKRGSQHLNEQELRGAKFRLLNEMLYSSTSQQALQHFQANKQDFEVYHEGYRHQSTKWHSKPVDQIIAFLLKHRQHYQNKFIADLGCGQGFIEEALAREGFKPDKMRSYDLVQTKPFIRVADIAHLPRKASTVDVCVFCLSLMGSNYLQFIQQAWRVLRIEGELIISEVESRSPDWGQFVRMVSSVGFRLLNDGRSLHPKSRSQDSKSMFFRTMHFLKIEAGQYSSTMTVEGQKMSVEQASRALLTVCTYKKR